MKTTLITGGAGFIGSHLCDLFINEGWRVICLDNLITGSMDNIAHLIDKPEFIFIQHDVSRHIDLEALLVHKEEPGTNQHSHVSRHQDQLNDNKKECEPVRRECPFVRGRGKERRADLNLKWILHFASPASPVDYLKYPIQTLKVGSLGTHNTLGLAKAWGAGFLLASTSEVYGDPQIHPQREDYWGHVNCTGPRGVYDEAKRFAEAMTMAYHRVHKLNTRIVRIFNTYGPRMRKNDGRAAPNFIDQALKNEPVTVYGDGLQTRSLCYITDLIGGIYKLMNSDLNESVNIGNPDEMTILELAEKIIELTGSKSKIEYRPLPVNDPKRRCPDISRAKEKLGWQPMVSLTEGLEDIIEWFRS